ncbi:PREDICTED: ejaculatory bulb-specific protein 3-like [Papilio polytes]|uniref:ejaculatory bulb-specific protein 3-like n=1 Tax=Papilio polytes TaxID=76194 RepID=UPI000675C524|nr:PREDICTED: ejaculatory bulb-specific protein 3-like [Papilio polytes]XP_013137232.1 PREDICTED: ejaculatory bulb-specific protein 3-like [Papilio polytes]
MTRTVLVLMCVLAAALAETYTDKYDNVNLQEIADNERLLQAYVNCLLEKAKCSPEGKELKAHMKDAIESGCAKCTDTQKKGTNFMINHLILKKPEIWNLLADKFDPTGKWRKVYEERARENGIVIPH